ncbi:MAG: radical SAM protein [Methanothrix sp.]|nr:radical SAM protein [Methanothrix sp.]
MIDEKPALLALSVTGDCNLRCSYCYARGGESSASMSWVTAKRAVDVMAQRFPSFKIQFTGGEPLLNLGLIERAVDYLDELGLRVPCQVQTNATLIIPDVAAKLKSLKIAVGVSLDGPALVNDALRPFPDGRGSTGSALKGIFALREEGIRVGATCVLSSANAGALAGLVDLLSYLGNVEGVAMDLLRPVGRASRSMQPEATMAAKGIEEAIKRADRIAEMGGRRIRFREIERMKGTLCRGEKRLHHCYFDSCRSLVVLADGRSYVCPSLLNENLGLGDIMAPGFADGLLDRMAAARRLVQAPQVCRNCPDRWLCGGPCLAHYVAGLNLDIECLAKKVFMRYARKMAEKDRRLSLST